MTPLWIRPFIWHTRHVRCPQSRWKKRKRITRAAAGITRAAAGQALRTLAPALPVVRAQTYAAPLPLPRRIWMYWDSGATEAPEVVRRCIASWRELNPDWEVKVLDAANAKQTVDLDFLPSDLRIQLVTDVLRLELLRAFGGVWADATCLCTRPLDNWLDAHMGDGFYAFAYPPASDRMLANWFLAATPQAPLIVGWSEAARSYWRQNLRSGHIGPNGRYDQFIHHYLFEWMLKAHPSLARSWDRVTALPARPPHYLQAHLKDPEKTALAEKAQTAVADPTVPMQKLDWRIMDGADRLQAFLASAK